MSLNLSFVSLSNQYTGAANGANVSNSSNYYINKNNKKVFLMGMSGSSRQGSPVKNSSSVLACQDSEDEENKGHEVVQRVGGGYTLSPLKSYNPRAHMNTFFPEEQYVAPVASEGSEGHDRLLTSREEKLLTSYLESHGTRTRTRKNTKNSNNHSTVDVEKDPYHPRFRPAYYSSSSSSESDSEHANETKIQKILHPNRWRETSLKKPNKVLGGIGVLEFAKAVLKSKKKIAEKERQRYSRRLNWNRDFTGQKEKKSPESGEKDVSKNDVPQGAIRAMEALALVDLLETAEQDRMKKNRKRKKRETLLHHPLSRKIR